jgi:hypothetical protein
MKEAMVEGQQLQRLCLRQDGTQLPRQAQYEHDLEPRGLDAQQIISKTHAGAAGREGMDRNCRLCCTVRQTLQISRTTANSAARRINAYLNFTPN